MDDDDLILLKSAAANHNVVVMRNVIKRLKKDDLFNSDYADIFNVALQSKNKDIIEAVLPIVSRDWNDFCFLKHALQYRLSKDIIEVVQPSTKDQLWVLKSLIYLRVYGDITYWSKSVNSDVLDKKIIKELTPHLLQMKEKASALNDKGTGDVQHLVDLIEADMAQRQHDAISSALPSTNKVCAVRKI